MTRICTKDPARSANMSIFEYAELRPSEEHYGDLTSKMETQTTSIKPASLSNWIFRPRPLSAPRVRLFCFPHGGGNALAFKDWAAALPEDVEVCAVQLPGRGVRMLETPAESITQIIIGLTEAFHPYQETPVALFGHSLGALVSFEFARRLRTMGDPLVHLFVSGRAAPQLPDPEAPISHLPTPKFVDAVLKRYRNIPEEILNDPDMMNLWLPALRADFMMNETYQYTAEPLLECPISSFGGIQDASASPEELAAWRHQTSGTFRLNMFPGDHFFINSARESVLKSVAADLERSLRETISSSSRNIGA
jgi:medium-chain acyl-[acyl-carrier-protein] hydrolase